MSPHAFVFVPDCNRASAPACVKLGSNQVVAAREAFLAGVPDRAPPNDPADSPANDPVGDQP